MRPAIQAPFLAAALAVAAATGVAQERQPTFNEAQNGIQQTLEASVAELEALRERITAEKLPMSRRLSELESELRQVRAEYQDADRTLTTRKLDVSNLERELKSRRENIGFLRGQLASYIDELNSRIHIVEQQLYQERLDEARLAAEDSSKGDVAIVKEQVDALDLALDRLDALLGGQRFEGYSMSEGVKTEGDIAIFGPAAWFRANDGSAVGTTEMRIGSLEPTVIGFANPEDAAAASRFLATGKGSLPVDPTNQDAHRVEATEEETLLEHIQKGGAVMYPILGMFGLVILVAIYKLLRFLFIRRPSRKQMGLLMQAVGNRDAELAQERARPMKGPIGRMFRAGADHLHEPKELIEEVMYESMLKSKLKLNSMLPFIAICAAAAPLMGLLGTVTGIINTFKLIELFGTGDPKTLSGGISEALITTKFGLIVAIPSLLIHAYLSRKARGIAGQMETAAMAFVNQLASGRARAAAPQALGNGQPHPDPQLVREQVSEILGQMLGPITARGLTGDFGSAGSNPSQTS